MNYNAILKETGLVGKAKREVVSVSIPADLETPVSAYLKLRDEGARFLLESVESGLIVGRYSFIGMQPESKIIIESNKFVINRKDSNVSIPLESGKSPLGILKSYFSSIAPDKELHHSRLLGGAVGFISYDFIRFLEHIPNHLSEDNSFPMAMFYMIDTLLVFDHVTRDINILCLTNGISSEEAREKVNRIKDRLMSPLILPNFNCTNGNNTEPTCNFTKDEFCAAVDKVKEYITAGDVYQQVISKRIEGSTDADPFMIYRALRMLNPSPYMYFLDFDELKLIGSSPEAMVRLEKGLATVRPIAGTRPRGKSEDEDRRLKEELLNDEKEKAEHLMLVDLARNDLGRCCEIGSVRVTDFMTIEKYSHVMHIISNVVGRLKPEYDQFDLFEATFPAGTLTGAPKIRSMQLIEEIEKCRRGPYAGAVGYFSLTGDADWCINIRTVMMQGKKYFLQGGAGIVADSVPEREFIESQNKIAALKKAIEIAEGGF